MPVSEITTTRPADNVGGAEARGVLEVVDVHDVHDLEDESNIVRGLD